VSVRSACDQNADEPISRRIWHAEQTPSRFVFNNFAIADRLRPEVPGHSLAHIWTAVVRAAAGTTVAKGDDAVRI
jgi:hypothetical protein